MAPYIAHTIKRLRNSKGVHIETTDHYTLCRCGKSGNKPFCDGTHASIDFSGVKLEGRVPDQLDDYPGREITIHDNRGYVPISATAPTTCRESSG